MSLHMTDYVTLGRSGLRVSPFCLGTMTFGTEWGWGSEEGASRAVFNRFIEAGGNFLDTADMYTQGTSEEMLGRFIADRRMRDRVVLATKFTMNTDAGNPNGAGNGRKNIYRALEASLRRLGTDFVDLYWMHCWDAVTPVEEVLSTLSDLVHQGKIRHYGFSDVPAWYAARAWTLAEKEGKERPIALQLEYSLIERNIEREHVPAAQELGLGITPWSPLAGGFLTGKYRREGSDWRGEGRLDKTRDNPIFDRFTERNWRILDELRSVARQIGRSPAQVALAWVAARPGITSTIIGATKTAQLDDNLEALYITIPDELRGRLDATSEIEPVHPYKFFGPDLQARLLGGMSIRRWSAAHATGGVPAAAPRPEPVAAER